MCFALSHHRSLKLSRSALTSCDLAEILLQRAIGAMGLWDADSAMFDTFCLWYSLCSLYFQEHVARRILALFGIIGLEGVGIILAAIAFARNRDAIQSLGHKMSQPHCPGFLHASLLNDVDNTGFIVVSF